jgi:hypothetical protein
MAQINELQTCNAASVRYEKLENGVKHHVACARCVIITILVQARR